MIESLKNALEAEPTNPFLQGHIEALEALEAATEKLIASRAAAACSAGWVSTNDTLPPPMKQVYACIQYDLSGCKEYAILEHIPARHHLMQDDPEDVGESDDDGCNWWPEGWYSSLPESGAKTGYDDMRFPINEAEFCVIAWMDLPTYGNPAKTIPGQCTGHVPCKKCGRSHWMHGACESLANAGGMARELAAQDSDNSHDING